MKNFGCLILIDSFKSFFKNISTVFSVIFLLIFFNFLYFLTMKLGIINSLNDMFEYTLLAHSYWAIIHEALNLRRFIFTSFFIFGLASYILAKQIVGRNEWVFIISKGYTRRELFFFKFIANWFILQFLVVIFSILPIYSLNAFIFKKYDYAIWENFNLFCLFMCVSTFFYATVTFYITSFTNNMKIHMLTISMLGIMNILSIIILKIVRHINHFNEMYSYFCVNFSLFIFLPLSLSLIFIGAPFLNSIDIRI